MRGAENRIDWLDRLIREILREKEKGQHAKHTGGGGREALNFLKRSAEARGRAIKEEGRSCLVEMCNNIFKGPPAFRELAHSFFVVNTCTSFLVVIGSQTQLVILLAINKMRLSSNFVY